jgi:hypothetical protein
MSRLDSEGRQSNPFHHLIVDALKRIVVARGGLFVAIRERKQPLPCKMPEVAYVAECVGNVIGVALIGMGIRAHINPVDGENKSNDC